MQKEFEERIMKNEKNIIELKTDIEWLKKSNWLILTAVVLNIVVNLVLR